VDALDRRNSSPAKPKWRPRKQRTLRLTSHTYRRAERKPDLLIAPERKTASANQHEIATRSHDMRFRARRARPRGCTGRQICRPQGGRVRTARVRNLHDGRSRHLTAPGLGVLKSDLTQGAKMNGFPCDRPKTCMSCLWCPASITAVSFYRVPDTG